MNYLYLIDTIEEGIAYMTAKKLNVNQQNDVHLFGLTDSDVESIQDILDESSDDDCDENFVCSAMMPRPKKSTN